MKKSIIVIVLAMFCIIFHNYAVAQNAIACSAKIVFDKNVYDYDTIVQGANGDCVFRFTNIGDAPLLIADVNASCGCTKPRWDKKPVMPGKSGVIHVTYNTMLTGHFRKTLVVRTNAANGNNQVLRIKGFVRQKCRKQI